MAKIKFNGSKRIITLGDITKENSCDIIKFIYDANEEDKNKPISKREPVKIIVNSSGGEVYDGLAIIDVIDRSVTPVYTIGFGSVMSMALVVYAAGHHRTCGKFTTFMYHETSFVSEGKIIQYKQEIKEAERIDLIGDNYLLSRTRLTQQVLDNARNTQRDWYFDAQTAYEYGIVDEILD
jgi:ATP-dependent Clp protease protease subunit